LPRYWDWDWDQYSRPSVAEQRRRAADEVARLKKKGVDVSPVCIDGRTISRTFWGKSWCRNLEAYSDYSNRLPRGRSYVRHGCVVDLKVEPGHIGARVSGTSLYRVSISIQPLKRAVWRSIKSECFGKIDSLLDLLKGKLSPLVMEIVTRRPGGLFPSPSEIELDCSCPDSAGMCKHIAAVLYGVGARLDEHPELLFVLRKVNHMELIGTTETARAVRKKKKRPAKVLKTENLSEIFGVDVDGGTDSD
jgi:uncharacterized Zn finger protein